MSGGDTRTPPRRMLRAAVMVALAAAVAAGPAGAVTPANGGDAGGTTTTINNGTGDQTEPHVSGDLAAYTVKDFVGGSTIHYFDFATGNDRVGRRAALQYERIIDASSRGRTESRGDDHNAEPADVRSRTAAIEGGGGSAAEAAREKRHRRANP